MGKSNDRDKSRPYYGWFVVAAGTLTILAALGFGRFALGMLLPSMGKGLSLSASQMGIIGTANFGGYLCAVAFCILAAPRISARRLIAFALALSGSSMLLLGITHTFSAALLFYTATGVGSGLANIPVMTLVSTWFKPSLRGRAAGLIVIGSGFAIIISGWLIPWLNGLDPVNGWRKGWMVLGASVVASALATYLVIRDRPEEIGLTPLGTTGDRNQFFQMGQKRGDAAVRPKEILHLAAIYFCFGFSYVIYVTFVVVAMTGEKGISEDVAGRFWSLIGALSLLSGPIPGAIADRFGRRAALFLVFLLQTTSYTIAALPLPPAFMALSVTCFGVVAWSIPSIMTALVADMTDPADTARIFALVTLVMAVGQMAGPAAAGLLADHTGTFSAAFYLAAGTAATGAALSGIFKKRSSEVQPTAWG